MHVTINFWPNGPFEISRSSLLHNYFDMAERINHAMRNVPDYQLIGEVVTYSIHIPPPLVHAGNSQLIFSHIYSSCLENVSRGLDHSKAIDVH